MDSGPDAQNSGSLNPSERLSSGISLQKMHGCGDVQVHTISVDLLGLPIRS